MGVITQKVGDGSYLNKDASSVLAVPMEFLFLLDDTSLQELTEMRLMMEPALAAKAAERATAQHIALLRQSIIDLEHSKHDRVRLVASDLLFHRAIFQASGNRLAGRLFQTIHRAMLNMIMVTSQLVELEHTSAVPSTDPDCDRTAQSRARFPAHDRSPDRCARSSASQPASRKRLASCADHLAIGQSVHKRFRKANAISRR